MKLNKNIFFTCVFVMSWSACAMDESDGAFDDSSFLLPKADHTFDDEAFMTDRSSPSKKAKTVKELPISWLGSNVSSIKSTGSDADVLFSESDDEALEFVLGITLKDIAAAHAATHDHSIGSNASEKSSTLNKAFIYSPEEIRKHLIALTSPSSSQEGVLVE